MASRLFHRTLLLAAFLVGAVQLSGGRSGLLAVVVSGVWFAGAHLRRRHAWRAAGVVVAVVLGLGLAALDVFDVDLGEKPQFLELRDGEDIATWLK